METGEILQRLGIALGLGLLIGLQRERSGSLLAGFRTFPLIALLGALAGLASAEFGGWILGAAFLVLGAFITAGNLAAKEDNPGMTTEVAMGVMFLLGAYLMHGTISVAVIVGGIVAILLHLKPQMHAVARRLGDRDLHAIMQFVLITLIILPILPNQAYGPFKVLNPFKIWLMVVLIVGISLGGYITYKFLGERVGTLAGGVLGGLISSTATTVSYARRSKQAPGSSKTAALVIMVASTIVFVRVLIIIGASAPNFLQSAWMPIGTILLALGIVSVGFWFWSGREPAAMPEQSNPSELKAALIFAGLYALVLLGTAAAKHYYGSRGLFLMAIISGLTDMDAITLSLSQLVQTGQLNSGTGWKLVVIAALSNLVFKAGTVAALGNRALLGRVAVLFGIAFGICLAVLLLWPTPS